jgi:phage gpG-like protein
MMAKVAWKKDVLKNILNEQEKVLISVGFQLERYVKESMREGGGKAHIPSAAGEPPHVQTGRLRSSISTNWTGSGLNRGATDKVGKSSSIVDGVGNPGGEKLDYSIGGNFKVVVGTNVEYAPALEFGSSARNISPRPFMRPAFDALKPKILKMLKAKGV